jgi:uncharacterized membrane protein YdbT with pleckstrin-like domain
VGIPDKHLNSGEEVVLDLHPHWWYLAPRSAALIGAIALGGVVWKALENTHAWYATAGRWAAILLIVVTLFTFLARLIQWSNIDFVVTSERCIYRAGVFAKNGIEIPLDRINTVFFNQGVFERIVGAGDLGIESAGENSRQEFSDIAKPSDVQKVIYTEMERYELRRQDRLGSVVAGATGGGISTADELSKLHGLLNNGAITQAEYDAQKSRLLG